MAVVVVTGAGERAFCTGADLNEQATFGASSGQYWRWMGAFIEMHDRLRNIGKPTIARINGICVGGGNELQMACDLSVLVDDAYIRHVGPEHGSVPAGGATQWLPIMVGDRRAREIVMLCEEISPAQALDWGLVNRVVARGRPGRHGRAALAESLRRKLPETIRYTKTQLNWWRDLVWAQTVTHARDWLAIHSGSDETREAVRAFHDKRAPDYEALRATAAGGETRPAQLRRDAGSRPGTRFCAGCGVVADRAGGGRAVSADGAEDQPGPGRAAARRRAPRSSASTGPKQLNALNAAVMDALCDALEELDRDDDVRAIVVTGNERAFAAGADIGEMANATPVEMLRSNRIGQWDRVRKIGKPVIAAVNGWCLGGGCELAMTLDLIIAGEGARFGQPEINIGVIPGAGGTQRLTRAIGKSAGDGDDPDR